MGFVGILEGTQKVLVIADHFNVASFRSLDCLYEWNGRRSFYLYLILG